MFAKSGRIFSVYKKSVFVIKIAIYISEYYKVKNWKKKMNDKEMPMEIDDDNQDNQEPMEIDQLNEAEEQFYVLFCFFVLLLFIYRFK